jgi:diguanylate cyclase (GGDEF)-like protein/PAS domain S-box-containing protein
MTAEASAAPWPGQPASPERQSGPVSDRGATSSRRLLTALHDLACAPRDPAVIFELLAASALDLFPADCATACELVDGHVVVRVAAGPGGPTVGTAVPLDSPPFAEALRSGMPQIVHDPWPDRQIEGPPAVWAGFRSLLVLPLRHDERPLGLVAAASTRPGVFSDEDRDALELLTDVAASALAAALASTEHVSLTARSAAVVDALGEGLVEIAADGRMLFANRSAERMLGFTWQPSTTSGGHVGYGFLREDGQAYPLDELPAYATLATGEPRSGVVVGVQNPGGEMAWLLVNTVPVCDGDTVTSVISSFTDITEQRRLEVDRREDDSRLRAAQELTGLAWWSLDLETGKHVWSDEMFRLVGLEPGRPAPDDDLFLAMIHPADRPSAEDLRANRFFTGHGDVFRVIRPDGEVRHLQSWVTVDPGGGDRPGTRVRGATIDVTDRELAAAELRESRSVLAAALELAHIATWQLDVLTGEVTWSDEMRRIMGLEQEHVTLDDFFGCLHPDDRERMRAMGDRQVSTGTPEETEYRVVHRDGSVHHVRALTDLRTTENGAVLQLWGTAVDITDQRNAAAQLAASEEHFRVAFENAPIGMSMISLEPEHRGRYLRTNTAFCEMLGYSDDEIVGQSMREVTHPEDVERDEARFARLVSGELPTTSFQKRYRRRDGSTVHAWLTSAVVHAQDGRPLYLVNHAVDISDRLREQAELERLALTDTLTGLANRTLLNDRLDQALARLQRTGDACAMLLLDVDRFKFVNDSLGHLVGDALLVEIAGRITDVSRADATVARLGGDEFVVLVENVRDLDDLHAIAQRLLETLRRPYSIGPGAESLVASVSIGIAIATSPERTYIDLYREADLALYRAKDAGRDQFALFDDELRARADDRMTAEAMLRRALAENTLTAEYQPLINLEFGDIRGIEALARITLPDGSTAYPKTFMDVAEDTGMVVEIDARMFELAVAQYARIRDMGLPLKRVGTNVSARSLEDPGFVDRLRQSLVWHGVDGEAIRIELTESSLLTTSHTVASSVALIRELGMRIGLDDFGTGYSALAYLGEFDLQFLKIDRSFVSRLRRSPEDDAVVAAVITLAKAHQLVVVGEGVETAEQLAALRDMGCDWAQGFLIAKPMSGSQLEELLASDPRW